VTCISVINKSSMPRDFYPEGPFISQEWPDSGEFDELREDFLFEFERYHTARAYNTDLEDFRSWCVEHHVDPLQPTEEEIDRFLQHLRDQDYAPGTVKRHAAAVRGFLRHTASRAPKSETDQTGG
jgi:site-specific recombinase XerD